MFEYFKKFWWKTPPKPEAPTLVPAGRVLVFDGPPWVIAYYTAEKTLRYVSFEPAWPSDNADSHALEIKGSGGFVWGSKYSLKCEFKDEVSAKTFINAYLRDFTAGRLLIFPILDANLNLPEEYNGKSPEENENENTCIPVKEAYCRHCGRPNCANHG